jgi:replicative DNA helicase
MNPTDKMLNPQSAIANMLGSICNKPELLIDNNVSLDKDDFVLQFHKIVFTALNNIIAEAGTEKPISAFDIDTYLKSFEKYHQVWSDSKGLDYMQSCIDNAEPNTFSLNYKVVKKMSLLRMYKARGFNLEGIYDYTTTDLNKFAKQQEQLAKMSLDDIVSYFDNLSQNIKDKVRSWENGSNSFKAGDDLEDFIKSIQSSPLYGLGFNDGYLNTLTGGMQLGKFYLRSMATGRGKTRLGIMDLLKVSAYEMYDTRTGKWYKNPSIQSSLFISTELEEDEINLILLSAITKLQPDKIRSGNYSVEEKERLDRGVKSLKKSELYFVELPEFSIADVENVIDNYILNYGCQYINFDYLQMCPKLARTTREAFKDVNLRDDQILLELATRLKNVANKRNVYIESATQLNGSHSSDDYYSSKTESALRGAKAIADKIDVGMIVENATSKDLKNLSELIENLEVNPKHLTPNMGSFIYKNRNGSKGVIVWSKTDLATLTTTPLFVTDYGYNLLDIPKTRIVLGEDNKFVVEDEKKVIF